MAVIIRVRDMRTFVMHEYGLADPVQQGELVIGRDPSEADLVLDDPAIQPRHAVFMPWPNHHAYRVAGDPDLKRDDYKPFYLGPFGLQLIAASDNDFVPAAPPPSLAARVTGRRARSIPVRPSVDARLEHAAQRMFTSLCVGADRIRALDRATTAWCEAQLAEHLARLSRATPGPPLELGQVMYTASRVDAIDRWTAEWSAVQYDRYVPAQWNHLRRLSRWAGEPIDSRELWMLHEALRRLPVGPYDVAMEDGYALMPQVVTDQLTLWYRKDPTASPIAPLIALAERGGLAFALPSASMLIYAPWLEAGSPPDPREAALRHRLWTDRDDLEARMVYADLLEQRGEHARAGLLRRDPSTPRRMIGPSLYPYADPLLIAYRPGRPGHPRPGSSVLSRTPSGPPPSNACLQLSQPPHVRFPLFAQTLIHDFQGQVRIEDAALVPSPVKVRAYLTYDESVFWLRGDGIVLNDHVNHRSRDHPMADGDELRLTDGSTPFILRIGGPG
jgi:uncharacterized protein (TIGR02996 family)